MDCSAALARNESDAPFPLLACIETPEDGEMRHLVQRVANGDAGALNALHARTRVMLLGIAKAVLRNVQDAEEVVNDVFMSVWREAPIFDPSRGTVIRWLRSICRNRAIDSYRMQHRRVRNNGRLYDLTCTQDGHPQEDHRSEAERTAVLTAVDGLPETRLSLLKLIYVEGLTFKQAADVQRLPLGTAKSHVRRCLQDLQLQLR